MRALSIDTSSPRATVALSDNDRTVAYQQNDDPKLHGERLLALIERACVEAGWARSQIDLVACGVGPGSFAGVRIGVATAKGIALALDRPIQGVCSLAAMADAAPRDGEELILTLLDARKSEIFWALYAPGGSLVLGPGHAPADALPGLVGPHVGSPVVAVGEVCARLTLPFARTFRSEGSDFPSARHVVRCALARYARGDYDDVHALEAMYIRPPDITAPATT